MFSFRMYSHLDNTCTTASFQGQFPLQFSTKPGKMSNRPPSYIWLQIHTWRWLTSLIRYTGYCKSENSTRNYDVVPSSVRSSIFIELSKMTNIYLFHCSITIPHSKAIPSVLCLRFLFYSLAWPYRLIKGINSLTPPLFKSVCTY